MGDFIRKNAYQQHGLYHLETSERSSLEEELALIEKMDEDEFNKHINDIDLSVVRLHCLLPALEDEDNRTTFKNYKNTIKIIVETLLER